MDKKKLKGDSKLSNNITAKDRQRQFAAVTHVSGEKLFCTPCNIVLEHRRKFAVDAHMKTDKHLKAIAATQKKDCEPPLKKQRMLDSFQTIPAQERSGICQEWVAMCAAANIPLSKTDHPAVRRFLQTRVMNGGAIPSSLTLSRTYLPREYDDRKEQVKRDLAGKPVAIMCDETSDDLGRFVLNVLASPLVPSEDGKVASYLLDTAFLKATNHSSVARTVVQTLTKYSINFNDVVVFNSDSAAYMKKAFKDVLGGLLPNAIHITCMAHIMNLLGDTFRKPFHLVHKFVKAFDAMFWKSGARKGRYLRYLRTAMPEQRPKPVPNPIGTRWNCWYDAVAYHLPRLHLYSDFIKEELAHSKSAAPESLLIIDSIVNDASAMRIISALMRFILDKSEPFISMTNIFQSQTPTGIKAYGAFEELQFHFEVGSTSVREAEVCQYYPPCATEEEKETIRRSFTEACVATAKKVEKYIGEDGQPGITFLEQVRIFHPCNIAIMSGAEETYRAIPGFSNVPAEEMRHCVKILGPAAVRSSPSSDIDLFVFWKSVASTVPVLSNLALRYVFCTCSSADVERSFSLYNMLVSSRRQSLSETSIKSLMFLYFNRFANDAFF